MVSQLGEKLFSQLFPFVMDAKEQAMEPLGTVNLEFLGPFVLHSSFSYTLSSCLKEPLDFCFLISTDWRSDEKKQDRLGFLSSRFGLPGNGCRPAAQRYRQSLHEPLL